MQLLNAKYQVTQLGPHDVSLATATVNWEILVL